ncbi:MAG: hypothetical protein AB7N70_22640 [Dehalococcoidia bacterium]
MAEFDQFLKELQREVTAYADDRWKDHRQAAIADGRAFITKTKQDLRRWTKLLASGDLTREDFEWLMLGRKDLARLTALKRKGLARAALDQFTNGLLDTVVSTAFRAFL